MEEEQKDGRDPDINVPVLSILEKEGEVTIEPFEQATAKYAKAGFRGARVAGEGHYIQLHSRDEVNELLLSHFAEVEAGQKK